MRDCRLGGRGQRMSPESRWQESELPFLELLPQAVKSYYEIHPTGLGILESLFWGVFLCQESP